MLGVNVHERWGLEETMRKGLPAEKRILTDEIYKILYFNNENPVKYNIAFWSDHFQISAAAIRNIVNYVAYPLVDMETKKVIKVMTFIDSDLQKIDVRLIGELNRENYFKYLEADYSQRLLD